MDFNSYTFDYDTGRFLFSDGVTYSLREALHISRTAVTMEEVAAIHRLKAIFEGEVLDGTEDTVSHPEKTRFDKLRDQAREMARQNIRYLSNRKAKNGTRTRHPETQTRLLLD